MPDSQSPNILHKSSTDCEPEHWQLTLANARISSEQLLERVELTQELSQIDSSPAFDCIAPAPLIARIRKGDINDPILKQILPLAEENRNVSGFVEDPLSERAFNPTPGLIHKYKSRVLLITSTACAVNCRYCFRRNFAYSDNRLGSKALDNIIDYLHEHLEVDEVILSGGDALVISNRQLARLYERIQSLAHIKRIRIHTRLPVVIPARVDSALCEIINSSSIPTTVVIHANHANELDETVKLSLAKLRQAGAMLLNQSVLLKGINDNVEALTELSERLYECSVLPYYLHLFDPVKGGHHFAVGDEDATTLYKSLQASTSGYLVPRLTREIPDEQHKTLIL